MIANIRNGLRYAAILIVAGLTLGGCGGARVNLDPSNWFSESSSNSRSASGEEGGFTVSQGSAPTQAMRAVTASDLVGPDGRCEGVSAEPPSSPPARGIGLAMTECELIAVAGTPEQVNLGASESGERRAVLTYTKGDHSGIYTFVSGRLKVIERLPTPPKPEPRRRRSRKKSA